MFPDELFTQLDIHHNVHRKGELLYFFPRRGRHMHIYNIQQNSMRSIEIRSKEEPFYIIEKVWVEKDGFVFIPMNRELYVKKYDFITKEVKRFERRGAFYDKDEKTKNDFPDKVLLKQKFHKDAEKFLWHYCQEEKCWNSFTPRGCELLFYREEKKRLKRFH